MYMYLTIQSNQDYHEEKEHRPKRSEGHLGDGFRVGNKHKTRT